MRTLIFILISFITASLGAQTPVMKSFATVSGQKILLKFDYPELIKVTTWDKSEISITGTVNINSGESDNAFELVQSVSGNTIVVENKINKLKDLPHRITVKRGQETITFKSKEEFETYSDRNGRNFDYITQGVDIKIVLEIKVPRNVETKIESTYGMVEIRNFTGPLTVDATYGGVDAALQTSSTGELVAETGFGQIYSNLDLKFIGSEFRDFHTQVVAKPGTGPRYSFESKYGNVYLRKSL